METHISFLKVGLLTKRRLWWTRRSVVRIRADFSGKDTSGGFVVVRFIILRRNKKKKSKKKRKGNKVKQQLKLCLFSPKNTSCYILFNTRHSADRCETAWQSSRAQMGHSDTGCAGRKHFPARHLIALYRSSPPFSCQSPLSWCVLLLKSFWGAAHESHQAFNGTLNTAGYIIWERVAEQATRSIFLLVLPVFYVVPLCLRIQTNTTWDLQQSHIERNQRDTYSTSSFS